MSMVEMTLPLYEAQPTDKWHKFPKNTPSKTKKVNLNEVEYYAKLGLTPKRIAPIIGICHTTIYQNSEIFTAYQTGRAFHVLWLKACLLEQSRGSVMAASSLLGRVEGPTDDDTDPSAPVDDTPVKIELSVVGPNNDPKVTEIKELLAKRMAEANKT